MDEMLVHTVSQKSPRSLSLEFGAGGGVSDHFALLWVNTESVLTDCILFRKSDWLSMYLQASTIHLGSLSHRLIDHTNRKLIFLLLHSARVSIS